MDERVDNFRSYIELQEELKLAIAWREGESHKKGS